MGSLKVATRFDMRTPNVSSSGRDQRGVKKRPRRNVVMIAALLALLLPSCSRPSAGPPTPTASATLRPAAFPSVTARIAIRYAELSRLGTPERITDEFSRDELVLNAEYLFEHFVSHDNLRLYSDRPFDVDKGVKILKETQRRLAASPVYDPQRPHLGFVCNDAWRSEFFLQGKDKYGGLSYCSIAPRVFFAQARIDDDVVLSPRGRPIAAPRTLTYYVTHEFSHAQVRYTVGNERFSELPKWLFEGYPDFVALGPGFTYDQAVTAYENRDPRVNHTMAGDYMLYDVLTAYYLEHKKIKVSELLADPPDLDQAKKEALGG